MNNNRMSRNECIKIIRRMFFQLYLFAGVIIIANIIQTQTKGEKMQALRTNITCKCGAVKVAIDSPSALRLVCYCKDCRGYYNTLNAAAVKNKLQEAATLDPFGG